jgi:hypothetical protein
MDDADLVPDLLRRIAAGSKRSNASLAAALAGLVLEGDGVDKAAELLTRIVTKEPHTFMQARIGASHWRSRLGKPGVPTRVMRMVASRMNVVNRKVFELYEADFGTTRATMHHLDTLAQHDAHMVPYFEVLVQNAVLGLFDASVGSLERLAEEWLPKLLDEQGKLRAWVDEIVARGDRLKHYGGDTNTILGIYDWIREDPELGFDRIPHQLDERFDLGAGFGTPYVEQLFRAPFVALDLTEPSAARRLGLSIAEQRGRRAARLALDRASREAYLAKLDAQAFRRYDVFGEPLPATGQRVLVTSFGFLSSTVVSLSPHRRQLPARLRPLETTYTAIRRVVELAATGRDVSLLTVQRATARAYMNRGVFVRFADRALVDWGVSAEPHQGVLVRGVVPIGRARGGRRDAAATTTRAPHPRDDDA